MAHVVAPQANIILVEANGATGVAQLGNLVAAVNTARSLSGVSVISMSWGDPEYVWSESPLTGETSYDSTFTTPAGHQGVTFLASSGDDGASGSYPAYSPNVVAVGGTRLTLSGNNYGSETGWSGSGGGQSGTEAIPTYQKSVQTTAYRQNPDVSFDAYADATSGVAVYDSYDFSSSPWLYGGGTSLSAPCWAGLVAIADQLRASKGLDSLDGPSQTLPKLYSLGTADFHDITSGSNGGYSAHAGYDEVTGIGTPVANLLVPDLASLGTPSTSQIQGTVWNDANGNGVKDTGEAGLANRTVYIDTNGNGQYDAGEPSQTTDANGTYTFSGLAAGTYSVGLVPQTGWTQTYPAQVTVANGGFESGNLSGWTLGDTTGAGWWAIDNGTYHPASGAAVVSPYDGTYSAICDPNGQSTIVAYQTVTLPAGSPATLDWVDQIDNFYTAFVNPTQQFRVEVRNSSDQVLATLFSTNPGDPLTQGWTHAVPV